MTPTPRQLGVKLKSLREAKGLSQGALARKARITREYVNRLEAGRHDPTIGTLQRLARALGVSLSELTGGLTMVRWLCEACGTVLRELVRGLEGAPAPVTIGTPAKVSQKGDRHFLTCPGCGARIELVSDPPGGNVMKPLRGVRIG